MPKYELSTQCADATVKNQSKAAKMLLKGEEVCIKLLNKLKTKFPLLCSSLSEFVPFCIPNFGTNLSW